MRLAEKMLIIIIIIYLFRELLRNPLNSYKVGNGKKKQLLPWNRNDF